MPEPKRAVLNHSRERRIEQEIVVDAYTPDDARSAGIATSTTSCAFPSRRRASPRAGFRRSQKGAEVEVLGMAPEDEGMFVVVVCAGCKLGVPPVQIDAVKPDNAGRIKT